MNNIENFSDEHLRKKILELRIKHRALDADIARLEKEVSTCTFNIRRLKKEKLSIKDNLTKLESKLIPNLDA